MDPQRVSHLHEAATSDAEAADGAPRKKAYRKPRLTLWGDLRDVTLGPSPGIGESGQPGLFKA